MYQSIVHHHHLRKSATVYANRAHAFTELGDYDKAFEDCETALQIDKTSAIAYLNRGWIYYKTNRLQHALTDTETAIELDPSNTDAYDSRARIFAHLERYEEALNDYRYALELGDGLSERQKTEIQDQIENLESKLDQ